MANEYATRCANLKLIRIVSDSQLHDTYHIVINGRRLESFQAFTPKEIADKGRESAMEYCNKNCGKGVNIGDECQIEKQ